MLEEDGNSSHLIWLTGNYVTIESFNLSGLRPCT